MGKKGIASLFLILFLVAAGCSAPVQPSQSASQGTSTGTGAQPAKPAAPTAISVAMGAEPVSLEPITFSESTAQMVIYHVFNRLFMLNEKNEVVPQLAESGNVSADGLTWTFKLKQGIKFHDGTPFDANAVKVFVDKILAEKPPLRASFVGKGIIASAKVVDSTTIEVKTLFPFGGLPRYFAGDAAAIMSPAAYEKHKDQITKNPVGTGPYVFKEWVKGERIVLERNPEYWGARPYYDKITVRFVPEAATRVLLLESGEVDVVTDLAPTEIDRISKDAKLAVTTAETNRIMYLAFNVNRKPLDDLKVRQALNYAVDKEAIVKSLLRGLGRVADGAIPAQTWGHANVGVYKYDPTKAKELLAQAGVQPGTTIRLWVPAGRYFQDKAVGEAIANYWKEVGLKVDYQAMEWGAYRGAIAKPPAEARHDVYMLGWSAGTRDADLALNDILNSKQIPPNGINRGYFNSPRLDQLLDQGRRETDLAKRQAIYTEAQKLILEEAPWVFLYESQTAIGHKRSISGLEIDPSEFVKLLNAKGS